jgi:ABC-type phosphate/phosphonate transport system substrate-binding protein
VRNDTGAGARRLQGEVLMACKKKTITKLSAAAACFICLAALTAARDGGKISAETRKREYVLGAHFSSSYGISATQQYDMANTIIKITAGEGFPTRIEKYSSSEELVKAFIGKRIDGAYVGPNEVAEIIDGGGRIHPWVSYTVNNKNKSALCFFYRKGSAINNITDLQGLNIVQDTFGVVTLIRMREYLAGRGIDRPLWQVFSSFTRAPNQNSSYMAVAMGKGDVTWDYQESVYNMRIMNPAVEAKMDRNFCTEALVSHDGIILNEKTLSPQELGALDERLKIFLPTFGEYAKGRPEIEQLLTYWKMTKKKIIPASPDEYASDLELYKKAKANIWQKEARYIFDIMEKAAPGTPVKIKPTYSMCKDTCQSGKDKVKCIDACMSGK